MNQVRKNGMYVCMYVCMKVLLAEVRQRFQDEFFYLVQRTADVTKEYLLNVHFSTAMAPSRNTRQQHVCMYVCMYVLVGLPL